MHIPEREAVLRRLVGALRPGGLLLLEEDDIHPVLATARGAYREAWDAFLGVMGAGGTDPEWARDLPERLGELGLVDVDAEVDGQLFRGGSDAARFWSVTWQQGRDRAISQGVPDAVVDAGIAVLGDPARWFHGPAKIVTWGRRPPDAPYVMGRTEAEHERLRLQAAQLEPATVELLDRVGIDAGASALDVGTGTGAVMRLLAERVGPGGRVVGVDVDGPLGRRAETELHAAGHLQTRFAEGDVLTMPLPDEGPFDVTYARLLLLHAADPPGVLRRMWEWTASGGAVVVQDYDQRSVAADPPLPLIDEFRRVVFAVFEAAGRALDPGLRLRRWFAEAGMGEIDGSAANGVVAPLTTARPIIEGVYRSMLPLALEWGVTGEAESAAWLDEFAAASPDHTVLFPLLLGAWKRKP
jgi:ubiquinone/menaquinone biosynthesis C-methylase UbiE